MSLKEIVERGMRDEKYMPTGVSNHLVCADGFRLSVIAGGGAYSTPRDGAPYVAVEVGFPSSRPEPWEGVWRAFAEDEDDPTETVYGYVPVDLVEALIAAHGGERKGARA